MDTFGEERLEFGKGEDWWKTLKVGVKEFKV